MNITILIQDDVMIFDTYNVVKVVCVNSNIPIDIGVFIKDTIE